MRRTAFCFCKSVYVCLKRRQLYSHLLLHFLLLQCIDLLEVHEENPATHSCVSRKRKDILKTLSVNYG